MALGGGDASCDQAGDRHDELADHGQTGDQAADDELLEVVRIDAGRHHRLSQAVQHQVAHQSYSHARPPRHQRH